MVFSALAIGTFLSVVDHGSVLVALPTIGSHFGTDLPTVQWVIVGYALAISVLLLPMGRLGDLVGRKQIYIAGFSIFIVASALAGASPNLGLLIGAKVLQGVGSAMIQGNSMAIVISTFSETERGKALGSHLSVVGTGAVAGPALGGFLVSVLDWRWVFLINVPIGLIGIAVGLLVLWGGRPSEEAEGGGRPAFDWMGAVLSGVALLAFLLVVGNGDRVGWTSGPVAAGAVAA
ncbi:MAG: MFS transporter, partial [Dehalococcoidia bacterium]|nr:MFS transporter [Dehalococcoidia bacterium]